MKTIFPLDIKVFTPNAKKKEKFPTRRSHIRRRMENKQNFYLYSF